MRIAAFIGAMLLILVAIFQDEESPDTWFAINQIHIDGDLKYVTEDTLKLDYSLLIGRSLLSLSVGEILMKVEGSEWVERAEVRKVWPNTLHILVHEYTPLAYWRDKQLISTSAVIITPLDMPDLALPKLSGPNGSSALVLEQFGLISQVLVATSLRISKLTLEPRGAWSIVFQNGLSVKLGRIEVLDRLQRFIAVYKSDLSGRIDQISSVDARYPHGVSVAWKKNK